MSKHSVDLARLLSLTLALWLGLVFACQGSANETTQVQIPPPDVSLTLIKALQELNDLKTVVLELQNVILRHLLVPGSTIPAGSQLPTSPPPTTRPSTQPPSSNLGGGTYVRWGRTSCPAETEQIYSGYAGGGYYNHRGAAADFLCLPSEPQYANFTATLDDPSALLYGTEYHSENRLPNFQNQDQDVPCSLCRSPTRSSVVMIPARTSCYPGYHVEYSGYLMAGHYNHASSSQFICVDHAPENVVGGEANLDGRLLFFVEGRCGSLRCPPYVGGKEIACVVCSK